MSADSERIYTIPLGKVLLSPDNRRAMRAINMIREFARHHMKVEDIRIEENLSHLIWARGIRRPPRKIRVRMSKTDAGHILVSPYTPGVEPATEKAEDAKDTGSKSPKDDTSKATDVAPDAPKAETEKPAPTEAEPAKDETKDVAPDAPKNTEPTKNETKDVAPDVPTKAELTKNETKDVPKDTPPKESKSDSTQSSKNKN